MDTRKSEQIRLSLWGMYAMEESIKEGLNSGRLAKGPGLVLLNLIQEADEIIVVKKVVEKQ